MPEIVTVRFRWSLPEVREANRWHRRQSPLRRWRWVFYALLAVGVLAWLYSYYHHAMDVQADLDDADEAVQTSSGWYSGPYFWLAVYIVVILGARNWMRRRILGSSYRQSAAKDAEIQWDFSEAMVRFQYPHGRSEFSWRAFIKARQTPKGFLLYQQPLIYNWIPKKGFASEADYEQVAKWIYGSVPNFRHLK